VGERGGKREHADLLVVWNKKWNLECLGTNFKRGMTRGFSIRNLFARHEAVLALVILLEVILFQALGRNFLTGGNVSNIFRHSVEIGLLALVMTPVILSGGIDLSVGSMMGLCAVVFGMLVKSLGLDPLSAACIAVCVGALGGALNAGLIQRFKMPPLIVTLGTFSLFRGLAEALTKGSESYSGFSDGFLALGNSEIAGVPAQVWILAAAGFAVWFLVHRTTFGRSLRAIGYAPEGARYAGLPVGRTLGAAYVLAGAAAGLAAVILVARLGEARANNGLTRISDYEIMGEKISGVARELSGMLTGLLLLAALAISAGTKTLALRRAAKQTAANSAPSP